MYELVEVLNMQTESKNDCFDEVHAHVLQAVCRRSNIHKTAKVPGVQPCIRAGGRSAALFPMIDLHPLIIHYSYSLVCAWYSTHARTLTFILYLRLSSPIVLCWIAHYFMALYCILRIK